MIFWTPNLDYDLLGSIFETKLKKLSLKKAKKYNCWRQFLQLCFKYASEQIIVNIGGSKYQILFKTLIRNIFMDMDCRAHKTATLTSIQHTVEEGVGRKSTLGNVTKGRWSSYILRRQQNFAKLHSRFDRYYIGQM